MKDRLRRAQQAIPLPQRTACWPGEQRLWRRRQNRAVAYWRVSNVFFDFIEETPNSARVLIMGSKGAPSIIEACKRCPSAGDQRYCRPYEVESSRLAILDEEERTLFLTAEFVKKGMHGLAEWGWTILTFRVRKLKMPWLPF